MKRGGLVDTDAGSSLLLQGEFQSVAEDLDSRLLRTGSACLGRLTVEAEHLPAPERAQHTTTDHGGGGVTGLPQPGPQLSTGTLHSLNVSLRLWETGGGEGLRVGGLLETLSAEMKHTHSERGGDSLWCRPEEPSLITGGMTGAH